MTQEPPHTAESTDAPDAQALHSVPRTESAGDSSASARKTVLVTGTIAVLALPFAWLALHRVHPTTPDTSQSPATPAPATQIQALEQLARTQPSVDNRLNLSLAYLQADQPARAVPVLQGLLAQDGTNFRAWNNLCVAHNKLSEFKEAIDACTRAVTLAPTFQLAHNNLLWAQDQRSKALEAAAAIEALPSSAKTPAARMTEGMHYLHAGDYDHAIAAWQALLDQNQNSAEAASNIGVAYMGKGRPAEALPWFQRALRIDPSLQIARNNLAWAQSRQTAPR